MYYCFDKNINFEYTSNEIKRARQKENLLFYDSERKEFFDENNHLIDISSSVIFPRTGSIQVFDMNESIVSHGGLPVVSNEDIKMILEWPKYIKLKRKMEIVKGSDLLDNQNVLRIINEYGDNIFIKTKNKDFSDVIDSKILLDENTNFFKALLLHQDDDFIISDFVNICCDEKGLIEYRCFVLDGQVANISRITYDILHKISEDDVENIKSIVKSIPSYFPKYYVVDLFSYLDESSNRQMDIVEFNPIHASGIYLYNSIYDIREELTHQNVDDVSLEFADRFDDFNTSGTLINDRQNLVDVPNSFSSDLRSICYMGIPGVIHMSGKLSRDMYGKNSSIFNLDSFTPFEESDDSSLENTDFSNVLYVKTDNKKI